jgi:hypothetical protein
MKQGAGMFLAVVALTTFWWSGLACTLDRKECFSPLTFRQQSVGHDLFPDAAFFNLCMI